ncbi:4-phosphoerythronate dehydrogenase [Natronoflexus pectinivorans]|uniref:Erythronate-4-phosphate dehydrogenase n=1 Tax=Natronoflexus pectinivorans TaxID=682526 RepID=A0A4R2GP62_9BACT|nr:4-phosphoerythronate dehydrogenase [Natronoflexus pectinivorans]TCO10847.1 erythronate-4-phosphate dehydrogenase [Natronoflexus pectinivorans]
MKIVADDKIPFLKGVFEPYATVEYYPGKDIQPEHVKNADALIVRTRTKCNEQLLKESSVKIVATATIGTDHFDIPWLEKAGIEWCNSPGCNSGSVRQYIASVFAHLIKEGLKPESTTLGIVGVGMVGSKIEALARTLGFKVLLNDPPRERKEGSGKFSSLETLLNKSDIVTFHTPLNMESPDATFHLLNNDSIKFLKRGAIVINSSRGEVTSTNALLSGLDGGDISRLVLDVWENEPHIHPELHKRTWIATPHIAGYSMDGKANGTTMAVQKVASKLGFPLTEWTPESIPSPANHYICLDAHDKHPSLVAANAFLSTYDIKDDDLKLRNHPEDFEKIRGSYPIRREFEAWIIHPDSYLNQESVKTLKNLGFQFEQ